MNKVPPRSEIDPKTTWNISSIFASKENWQVEVERLKTELKVLSSFKGKLGSRPDVLLNFVVASEEYGKRVSYIFQYAHMMTSVDKGDQEAVAFEGIARELLGVYSGLIAYTEPEILSIGREKIEAWLEDNADLAEYRYHFEKILRQAPHTRSAEVEEVLSQLMNPFRSATETHSLLSYADMRFQPAETEAGQKKDISHGNIHLLLKSPDRKLRRTAWENYADAHLQFKNTIANCLAVGMKQDVFNVRVRNYDSSLHASLSPNNIPVEVFYTLVDTYRRHLPLWHRYWKIRQQALQLDQFHVYDVKAPLSATELPISFEQAVHWILEGMKPLGEDYVETIRRGVFEDGWVDIYPNQGKYGGAFSSGFTGTHPFILTNYTDDVYGMSTLAHELGHSMHSYLTWRHQKVVYSSYTMFVAEVASNFNQALVRDHLLKQNDDPDFQIAVIEEAMANFHRYFFIMPILACLELSIHEQVENGQSLTADGLINEMADLFADGFGPDVILDRDRVGITWAQFPSHMYGNFYVFQYATGISAAHSLAEKVLQEGQPAVDNYLAFLKAGGSMDSLEALKMAGVDMTSGDPVEKTFRVLASYIDRLAELLGVEG